ncbi:uncharacterized protein EDB93DRAFT_719351 [Suillus bovinus]|uniref:uncharacterized protein n=1 Tax=Suillus bovinus TaxID=48563 RepID=UPI001B87C6C4|nr:uncharacterized protein EDB93DRAFT_719351 [Suillus bovinus]KAG2138621.1 hypothetical protein EDB93DRAFT_719351 [Suillus bovinus]
MVGVQFEKKDIVRIDKSSALARFMDALLAKFQMVLCECDGGDLDKDSTGVTRRAWKLLNIICPILESAKDNYPISRSVDVMRNLDACRKIYSRLRSPEQNDPWELLKALKNGLRFTLTAAEVSRDPTRLWYSYYLGSHDFHPPEDFDWLVDYLEYIYSDDEDTAFDILLFLVVMKARYSPAKQHQFFKSLIACMGSNMPKHLRHVALRAANSAREQIASIDAIDDAKLRDMILTELSPAILTAVCLQPDATLSDHDLGRDLNYLELLFTLARNSNWHPHLIRDHIDQCISMITMCCRYEEHAFYLAEIFLQIAPEQLSVTTLDSVTEQQWWDMLSTAWFIAPRMMTVFNDIKLLLALVESTKKYIQIAPTYDLDALIGNVDRVIQVLEEKISEQGEGEGIAVAVKELGTIASDMLEKLVSSKGVISP